MNRDEVVKELTLGGFDDALIPLYGDHEETLAVQRGRYIKAIRSFETIYPESEDISIFSAPGRSEICGNHTDHQHGCVLAATIWVYNRKKKGLPRHWYGGWFPSFTIWG